ncbi:CHAP domain-containing protein [Mucilaginibacter sp. HC2]|uniref:CHAP domain-containing protein n=1 Tax=Mucilaginibacter inviolabilis TaxID=2714892 RepID=UPI00140755EA|nr:CHAP domain-containing protein [Mucilaginibacter inviolabilis]NHA03474.1 CHAP domain-containing protein [Mucilaginibacter inviolabilis]
MPSWWGNGQQFVNSNIANQGGPSVQDIRNNIVRIAENYEGSTAWGYYVAKGNFPARCNKCNLYVYDVLKKAGANPGLPHVNGKFPSTAADWANPFVKIPGWIVLTSKQAPMLGDIVAVQENYSDATGHVGIVIGPNLTSSFSSYTQQVTENDWGFRSDNGGWPVFRRYVGP